MAMLLAMFQKMRLIREKNQLVLEQTQYSSKLTRIEKNIERTQKRYTSLFAQIDSQAKMMQSQATVMFQNMFNLGANSVNPYNYSGMNGFVANVMAGLLFGNNAPGVQIGTEKDGTAIMGHMDENTFNAMMNFYSTNCGIPSYKTSDGEVRYGAEDGENWSQDEFKIFQTAKNMATQQQQYAQYQSQQLSQQYANNVSIWTEAAKAQLEMEQDAALEPLNYEQTMLELEKEQKDARLTRIEAELERYKELCSKEAQNSAPSFGLG